MKVKLARTGSWFLLLITAFNQLNASESSEALLSAPTPVNARMAVVGLDMRQNGALMSISTFRSTENIDSILEFYRSVWPARESDPGHVENKAGPWHIISRLEDNVNLVLQLQHGDQGGSEGLFSAVQINDVIAVPPGIELPPGGEVLSTTTSSDQTRDATTWIIRSTSGTGHTAAFYRDTLKRKGWQLVSDRMQVDSQVLQFNHRTSTLEMIVSQAFDGSTLSVINRVNHDG